MGARRRSLGLSPRSHGRAGPPCPWDTAFADVGENATFYELTSFRMRALTQRTSRKGFSERGIHPFNPDIITEKITG